MTKAEVILWSKLKGKATGYKFRRQYSVGAFVLDFYCPELKLAIEVDGDSHFTDDAELKDAIRERIVSEYGIYFLRFTNAEVSDNVDGVVTEICRWTKRPPRPSATPPC